MDTITLTALIKDDLAAMALAWQAETETREAASREGITAIANELFPGVDQMLLKSNKDVTNYLQQAVSRYLRALKRGELNWEWEGEGSEPDPKVSPGAYLNLRGRDLVQDATTDALVSGKLAFFPYLTADGRIRVTTLSGFLWPIYAPGDVSEVAALVQITAATRGDKKVYEVRRYSPGLLEVYSGLEDWREYAARTPERFETPAIAGRLPVAFRIVGRGLDRRPEGLAQTALPSFRRYVKFAVLLSFLATRGGFEERLVKSDKLFQLAEENPRHPLVQELKKVGVNLVRLLDAGASYERLDPVALGEYREQEAVARTDVQNAMNVPDTAGSVSGDALSEKRESNTETVESLASSLGDALTEANELAAALRPAELRPGYRVTLEPRFTRDTQAERKMLLEEYKAGLPRSAWLSGLQSLGVSQVTQAHIDAALAEEQATALPLDEGA
ncbi:hypothetical protein [Deinococcus humi]|uniref:Phage portal protein n=1 Tax=Deinococcus humi TaxID=662880 RepID=A0A7W8JTQ2_9DEIO|nr:hypothetical protein [Deinococcus humi]MBB5363082.1 hypothetical protein [Deinococcus humi]GGO24803.1 hypothetical protein GCM10008949_14040 [Deinococcus humi]